MKRFFGLFFVFSVLVFFFSGFAAAESGPFAGNSYIQDFENGRVDWLEGMVTAKGIGAPRGDETNMAQARAMARRAAVVVARRNLMEVIQGVWIDSRTTVRNFLVQNDVIRNRVRGYLHDSKILDIAYMSDGSVEATVGIKLRGGLADSILPAAKGAGDTPSSRPARQASTGTPGREKGEEKPGLERVYTGLIVDARGLNARPAMSPSLLDENGIEVYGSHKVSREFAIKQGMAGYAKDLDKAAENPRVSDNPFIAKAVKAKGKGRTNLVLGNEQANQIRRLSENQSFLEKCRVMIILD